jgi:hypothetical protein
VYARSVDSSSLVFSLSSHRLSYIGFVYNSRFFEHLTISSEEVLRFYYGSIKALLSLFEVLQRALQFQEGVSTEIYFLSFFWGCNFKRGLSTCRAHAQCDAHM